MMVTDWRCWCQNHYVGCFFSLCWWFSQCIKSVTNILNGSPTSQSCHQPIWSPTSVTNIDQLIVQRFFSMTDLFSVFSWLLDSFIFSSGPFFWVAKKQSNLSFRVYYHQGRFLNIFAQRKSILVIPFRKIKQNSQHWIQTESRQIEYQMNEIHSLISPAWA